MKIKKKKKKKIHQRAVMANRLKLTGFLGKPRLRMAGHIPLHSVKLRASGGLLQEVNLKG